MRATAGAAGAAMIAALGLFGVAAPSLASAARPVSRHQAAASCHLANGIKHVVEIGFDNVHYYRDNPNVPSDLEMLPSLLHFIEGNGTLLTNNHTPLIAHTADDLLTTFTGLYGDRAGMPVSNDYQTYNPDGTTRPARSRTGPTRSTTPPTRLPPGTTPTRPWSTPQPRRPRPALRLPRTRSPRRRGCRSPGPAATSARSPR
jgi:hypothetical protein